MCLSPSIKFRERSLYNKKFLDPIQFFLPFSFIVHSSFCASNSFIYCSIGSGHIQPTSLRNLLFCRKAFLILYLRSFPFLPKYMCTITFFLYGLWQLIALLQSCVLFYAVSTIKCDLSYCNVVRACICISCGEPTFLDLNLVNFSNEQFCMYR